MIRVLHLSRWLGRQGGGVQTYLEVVDKSLQSSDVENHYAALLADVIPDFSPNILWSGKLSNSKRRNAIHLMRWLCRHRSRFDVVHIHGVTDWHAIAGAFFCRSLRIPYVLSPHGALFDGAIAQIKRMAPVSVPVLKAFSRYLLRGAATVVPTSLAEARLLERIEPRSEVFLVIPGVEVLPSVTDSRRDERSGLRLLFIGRVEAVKAFDLLVESIAVLVANGVDVRLDVLGICADLYGRSMRSYAENLGIGGRIHWHGHIDGAEKLLWLRQADALVLPSISENFGFVVAEAMAAGVPVVVSEGVGLAPLVRESDGGEVFPVGNVSALVYALNKFCDPVFVQRCARNAQRAAQQHLSLGRMRQNLEAVYALSSCKAKANR